MGLAGKGSGMKEKFIRADLSKVLTTAGIEKDKARKLTENIIKAMTAALVAGKVIELRGMGTLETRERKPRKRHNPRTLKTVNIPSRKTIFFRPSGKLKEAINNGR